MNHIIRRRHAVPLAVSLTILLTGAAITFGQGGNQVDLLTNGGFEEGLAQWEVDSGHSLVQDPQQAHRGEACLTGEVTGPNQALRLRRQVTVSADHRYELTIWARGTQRTKLVVWATLPGGDRRVMVASWPDLTTRWRSYVTPLAIGQSGTLSLELITPSSYGAPAGRIWVDDIALHATKMPSSMNLTAGQGFHDEPAMAAGGDGSLYVAYNRFAGGVDSLWVERLEQVEDELVARDKWRLAGSPDTYLLGLQVVPAGERVAILYAREVDKNWDIYVRFCGPDGPSSPIRLTRAAAVDVKPAGSWYRDALWVAWESNRGSSRQILVASVQDGNVSEPIVLSRPDISSYDPSVCVLDNGQVCVAWHAFHQGSYDIYLRRTSETGVWGDMVQLTDAPTIDRHVALVGHGSQLWLVYENAQTERYHVTRTNRRRLVVAQVDDDRLLAPVVSGKSILDQRCEAGAAQFDDQGRLWLAMLRPHLPRAGWDVYLTAWSDGRWLDPWPVSKTKGMDRTPSLVFQRDRALLAFQADDIPRSWSDVDRMPEATSDIHVASLGVEEVAGEATLALRPLVESDEPFPPAGIRLERGEDTPTRSIQYEGKTYQLYYGDLHEHSDVSVCNRVGDQSLDESYQHLRDVAPHDFVCITDHGYNLNDYLWNYSAKWARVNDDPQRFLTFLGQEWTSSFEETSHEHPHGYYGHRNLILADLYFPSWWNARNRQKPTEVWEDLRRMNADFVHIPHQLADTGNVPTDWSFHDEVAQPVAEIFQTRGSYEYLGAPRQAKRAVSEPGWFLQDAWAQDIVIGVIASPDHGGGYGKACVFSETLTREAILDALRARRCYGTTAAKIFLDARFNGHLMGEKLTEPAGQRVTIDVHVRCPMPIAKIQVCRDNEFILAQSP